MSASYVPADRCERCGAHAKRKVTVHTGAELGDLVFLFCQHHTNEQVSKCGHLLNIDIEPLTAA